MNRVLIFLAVALSLSYSTASFAAEVLSIKGNRNVDDFDSAKRHLTKVFRGHETTIYCGCRYYGKEINLNSCGIGNAQNWPKRMKRLEWEHVMPAARFSDNIAAWNSGASNCKSKGRKCAEKNSALFRQMEADMHNLWPENGEINGNRSDKEPSTSVTGKIKTYGSCETRVGKSAFAPRPEVRGEVARAYLYMSWAYEITLSQQERRMFEEWDRVDKVSEWECERNSRIKSIQGNSNPFVDKGCKR